MINHLVRLLEKALADVNIKLADIDILLPGEKKCLLEDFNDTVTDYPVDRTIHELFETEVERGPDRIAVIGKRQSLGAGGRENFSYGWLNRQANRLARVLRARGVQADTIVGIMLGPSLAMIVGILGILKAGGAYLPIDRDYPGNRVVSMLEDCRSSLLVTEEDLSALSAVDVEVIPWDDLPAVDGTDGDGASVENSGPVNRSTHLAYVMFTSGSSGKPKGTLTSHFNVVRVVKNTNYIEIEPGDRILQLSNFAFDGSVFGIYGALLNGAVLVEVEKQQAFGLDELADIIKRERVTVFFVTTALFNALVETHIESLQGIGKVLFGGERVSVEHTKKALEELGTGKIIHMYGPTETTVYTTYYPVDGIAPVQYDGIYTGPPFAAGPPGGKRRNLYWRKGCCQGIFAARSTNRRKLSPGPL
jgi:non-ribosomal peptide synthetase component F